MPFRKPKTTSPANWLDDAVDVPREGLEVYKDRTKATKRWRLFLRASVFLLPLSLLSVALLAAQQLNPPVEDIAADTVVSDGKAAAVLAVEQWVGGAVSPLAAGGEVLSWDGYDVVERPAQTEQQKSQNPLPEWDLEIHHFTVADGLGVVYAADVQVAVGDELGAAAISTPTLLPRPLADTSALGTAKPWLGLASTQAPDPVLTAINSWADAFTGGDPDALRVNVQDDDGSRSYVPLYNVASHTVAVRDAAFLRDAENRETNRMVVQVQLAVQWLGSEPLRDGQQRPQITYDLLVTRADSGAPVVVAWGAAGTGPSLSAFDNAIEGRAVPAVPSPEEAAAAEQTTEDGS